MEKYPLKDSTEVLSPPLYIDLAQCLVNKLLFRYVLQDMLVKDSHEARSYQVELREEYKRTEEPSDPQKTFISEIMKVKTMVEENFNKLKASKDREISDLREDNERLTEALRRSSNKNTKATEKIEQLLVEKEELIEKIERLQKELSEERGKSL